LCNRFWSEWDDEQIIRFQLFQERLCRDFGRYHKAIKKVLGRLIYTHEFADQDRLIKEYLGEMNASTLGDNKFNTKR